MPGIRVLAYDYVRADLQEHRLAPMRHKSVGLAPQIDYNPFSPSLPAFFLPPDTMHIRHLTPNDAPLFRQLRLAALEETPSAFGSSLEEESTKSVEYFAARLAGQAGLAVFGAFDGSSLIGSVGLRREQQHKLAHKCTLIGMFVQPPARGHGIARALVSEAITFAHSLPGVRQINLCVNANNPGPVYLYGSMGFVSWGHEKASLMVDGVLHDELHMTLQLNTELAKHVES